MERPKYNIIMEGAKEFSHFYLLMDGEKKIIGMNDYKTLYSYPFLYEDLYYRVLGCKAHLGVKKILENFLHQELIDPETLNFLELGAGSGTFGELLNDIGIYKVSGLDIFSQAKIAAERDRKNLYQDYFILDLEKLSENDYFNLKRSNFNSIISVSATSLIPVKGFENALKLLPKGGIFVCHVRNDIENTNIIVYNWINQIIEKGIIEEKVRQSCFHRKSIDNRIINAEVIIGVKT